MVALLENSLVADLKSSHNNKWPPFQSSETRFKGSACARGAAMADGSCHGVRRTKEGPGQAQNGVEMLMHRARVTHHHCPLALEKSIMGGAGMNVNQNK